MSWPTVRLRDLLRRSENWIELGPDETYREVTVKLWGKGVVERRRVLGSEIGGTSRLSVRAGELILSRIDARNGAIGIVPPELDGAVVSNDFPCFSVFPDRLDVNFLGWLTRTRGFVEECRTASEGTTNRVRLKEDRFQGIEVRLPALTEQRRIVARIERLAAKVRVAAALRNQSRALSLSVEDHASAAAFASLAQVEVVSVASISESVTKGTTPKTYGHSFAATGVPFLRAEEVGDGRLNWRATPFFLSPETNLFMNRSRTRAGDVLVTIAGTIGRAAVVPSDAPQLNMNQAVCVIRPLAMADSDYLCHFIRSSAGQEQLRLATVTSALSNISLGTVRRVALPLPTLSEQRRIVAYLDDIQAKLDALKTLQLKTAAELDALMPSILDKAFRGDL